MARANPHSEAIMEYFSASSDNVDPPVPSKNQLKEEVMVLFNAMVNHYVTPKFLRRDKNVDGPYRCMEQQRFTLMHARDHGFSVPTDL
jgi:transcriptional regulator